MEVWSRAWGTNAQREWIWAEIKTHSFFFPPSFLYIITPLKKISKVNILTLGYYLRDTLEIYSLTFLLLQDPNYMISIIWHYSLTNTLLRWWHLNFTSSPSTYFSWLRSLNWRDWTEDLVPKKEIIILPLAVGRLVIVFPWSQRAVSNGVMRHESKTLKTNPKHMILDR